MVREALDPITVERVETELRAVENEEIQSDGNISFGNLPGVRSSRYSLRPEDESAWLACWQLKVDRWGDVYGIPHRLPKGQLGYYMKKTRPEDGGPRFTLQEPANVLPEPKFSCFIGDCQKRMRTRALLIRHVEGRHPQSAQTHKPLLDQIRQAVMQDDPRVADLVAQIAGAPDQPLKAMGRPGANSVSADYTCRDCGWGPKADAKNPRFALVAHRKKHGG